MKQISAFVNRSRDSISHVLGMGSSRKTFMLCRLNNNSKFKDANLFQTLQSMRYEDRWRFDPFLLFTTISQKKLSVS